MPSLTDVVDEIIRYIKSTVLLDAEILSAQVRRYQEAGIEIDRRVVRVKQLLDDGLRDDAMAHADTSPALLHELQALLSPELDDWRGLLADASVELPKEPQLDVLREVVDNLESDIPFLEHVLNEYRRLSLERAPLADRLQILRRLVDQMPKDRGFRKDLQIFEKARLAELKVVAKNAAKNQDVATLEKVLSELKNTAWAVPMSGKPIAKIEAMAEPLRRQKALRAYDALLDQLQSARSSLDEAQCLELLQDWKRICSETGVGPTVSQRQIVDSVVAWMYNCKQQRLVEFQWQQACDDLNQALEQEQSLDWLERLESDVLKFERGVPEPLQARLNSTRLARQRAKRRKVVIKALSFLGVSVGLLVCLGLVVGWHGRRKDLANWSGRIELALNEPQLEEARSLLEELQASDPELHRTDEIQALARRYAVLHEQERLRKARFDEIVESIAQQGPAIITPQLLQQAEGLARTYEERLQAQRLRASMDQYRKEQDVARDERIEGLLMQLQNRLAKARQAYDFSSDAVEQECQQCIELSMQVGKIPGMKAEQSARVAMVLQEAMELKRKWTEDKARRLEIERKLEGMAASVDDPDALARSFIDFAETFPQHPLSKEFFRLGETVEAWKNLKSWSKMRRHWTTCRVQDAEEAKQRLEQVEPMLAHGVIDWALPKIVGYAAYLQCAQQLPAEGKARAPLTVPLLRNRLIRDKWCIDAKDDNGTIGRFYFKEQKEIQRDPLTKSFVISVVKNGTGDEMRRWFKPERVVKGPMRAPVSDLVKQLELTFDDKSLPWETLQLQTIAKTMDAKGVDPVLKTILLRVMVTDAVNLTPFVKEQLVKVQDKLEGVGDDIAWMDPERPAVKKARTKSTLVLDQMLDFDELIREVQAKSNDLEKDLPLFEPVGMVLPEPGKIRLSQGMQNAELWVVVAEKDKPRLIKVGTIADGTLELDEKTIGLSPCGNIVFSRTTR